MVAPELDGGPSSNWDGPASPINPTTLTPLKQVPATSRAELEEIILRCHSGLVTWRSDSRRRAGLMRAWAEGIRADAEGLALDLVSETGKPLAEARQEVAGAADALDYNAGLARGSGGGSATHHDGSISRVVQEPIGVSALLVPWNWPVLLLLRDLAPALAAGVTAIVKPSPQTVHVTARVMAIARDVGFPDDVLRLVTGDVAVAQHLITHPLVRGVAFTGSTAVGQKVLAAGASTMTRTLLELGGKNPAILLEDADLDSALPVLARSVTITAGQMCMACSRIIVHHSLHERVRNGMVELLGAFQPGDPADPHTTLGPLISPAHAADVLRHLADAREHNDVYGGDLLHPGIAGHVVAPAVVDAPRLDSAIVSTDIFGPVVTIEPFTSNDEAVEMANATSYGLVASIWSADATLAQQMASRVNAGTVWVNGWGSSYPEIPAGGYKNSGLGRTRGLAGVAQFTEIKHIHVSGGRAVN